ncbi:MAG TPA: M20/M25/M40 family metallo-hydrolase [Longimicrobiaceae bacterium]|jgi:Zn-dependent M28 family amino/carboxypeptidase|nr:M20/M25/M40 family metallo-hydrolase [Longimicrobiaceae bacterium]
MPLKRRSALLARAAVALAAPLAAACATPAASAQAGAAAAGPAPAAGVRIEDVRASLGTLAHDSMEGRATGAPGSARAARFIAEQMRQYGLEAAGDSGYFQRVPLVVGTSASGRRTVRLLADGDTAPVSRRVTGVNVVGILRGSDPVLRDSAVLVDAHYDHLGVRQPVDGDSIYNGADDDASGVVAVLEIARAMAHGPRPRRTVIFLATTGEEVGLLGTRWYVAHPVVPLERTEANLEIEMIGRPDSLAGGEGKGWLTGYDRSTMGAMLRQAGIPIVPDPRPAENFFERSDNIAFARMGIPAHTLSSFNLHEDYHTPRDEVDRVDFTHLTAVIDAAARAVRMLADGPAPTWVAGGRPAAR